MPDFKTSPDNPQSLNVCVIGLGSNINPKNNIKKAIELISRDMEILKISQWVQTSPIGFKHQADFINGAILLQTPLTKKGVITYLKNIEIKMGRVRTPDKNGPRNIDLDLLIWNQKITDKDIFERDFLQKSIKELLPDFLI